MKFLHLQKQDRFKENNLLQTQRNIQFTNDKLT